MGAVIKFRHARSSLGIVKPKIAGSAALPADRRAVEKTRKCSAGIRPRAIQLKGAEMDLSPANSQAAVVPPTASITSETELSMGHLISRPVTMSSGISPLLGNSADSVFNHEMVSKDQIKKMMAALRKEEAARLDMAQIALELTNETLADKIGITQQAWSQYRTGDRPIPKEALYMLHRDYAITVQYILFNDLRGAASELKDFVSSKKSA